MRQRPLPTMPSLPSSWAVRRNKTFMAEARERSTEGSEEMLSVSHLTGVTPRSEKTVYMFEAASTVGYKVVEAGDLVINTMWAWMGAAGTATGPGIVSPAYGVYKINTAVAVPRFVDYLVRTPPYVVEMTRFSRGVTSSRLRLYPEEFLALHSPLPPVWEQRAIADHLDAQTSRVDALITKKQQLIRLLEERRRAELEQLLWSADTVRLKFVADLLPGYAFPSSDFGPDEGGPPLLRGTNVGVGATNWSERVFLAAESLESQPVDRYRLSEGDLVVGMDRPFIKQGTRVAPIGASDAGSLLVQRVCRVRPTVGERPVLQAAIASERFQAYVESDLTGVSVPHLSDEQIGDFSVPAGLDAEAVERIIALVDIDDELASRLNSQLELLAEHRQALITAAVTGELTVPGAA